MTAHFDLILAGAGHAQREGLTAEGRWKDRLDRRVIARYSISQ